MQKWVTKAMDGSGTVGKNTIGILPPERLGYLFVDTDERNHRRYLELLQRGEQVSHDQVVADLTKLDRRDSERRLSSLQPTVDAKAVNADGLDAEQVLAKMADIVEAG
jgi:cytidylate kinase